MLRKPVVKRYKVGMSCVCSYSDSSSYSEIVLRAVHLRHYALLNELIDVEASQSTAAASAATASSSASNGRHRWFILLDVPLSRSDFDPYLTKIESVICMDIDDKNPRRRKASSPVSKDEFVYRRNDTDIGYIGFGTYLSVLYEGERSLVPQAIKSLLTHSNLMAGKADMDRPIMEELNPSLISDYTQVPLPWIHIPTRSVLWFPIISP